MKSYNKRFVCVLSMLGVTIDVVLLGILGASFTTSACHCDTPVKFIRIVQTWNCESTTDAGGRWLFRLAELKLYGVSIK